jgi:Ca2+-binding RTX toxin-like protein
MPRIRIEWVPVQVFGLGLFGFDHLQLVYQQSDNDSPRGQDAWFVMEGVREATREGAFLGIEGADGRTTLSVANLAAREELVAKIGIPAYRGSRPLPYESDSFQAWETMASYARDIEEQDFPYIAYGLPGSPTPTINSSSAIASLIYYSGLDPTRQLPYGVHLSPGTATLLGTRGDDAMRIECGFSTLLGGHGRDAFVGGFDPHRIEKLYGGEDNDLFHWSTGFNIIHGGQPQLDYDADGTDVMDYAGAGTVTITFNRHWVPHKVPTYVAVFKNGIDHLFSIERIQWNETTDRIVLGGGVDLIEDNAVLAPDTRGQGSDRFDPSHLKSGLLINQGGSGAEVRAVADTTLPDDIQNLELVGDTVKGQGNPATNRLLGNGADNLLEGIEGDDTLYGGPGDDTLIGGPGSDGYVYLFGDGNDAVIDSGPATDVDELILAGGIAPEDVSLQRPSHAPDDLVLALAGGGRILIKGFFASPSYGIDRVVFDGAPAWTREDLQTFAAAAPAVGEPAADPSDDRLIFQPELWSGPALVANADEIAAGAPLHDGAVITFEPADTIAPPPWAGLDAQASWLF